MLAVMKISVILAHPNRRSFNHAIAQTAAGRLRDNGHEVDFHDLYQECFPPLLPAEEIPSDAEPPPQVAAHCQEIAGADGLVIVHPDWWGQPPAILTGWVDRVLRPGVAYNFIESDGGEGVPVGLLVAKTAIVVNTANTPPERERLVFGDPLEAIWKRCVFGLCGVNDVRRVTFAVVVTSTPEQRAAWLAQVRELVDSSFPAAD
jgi:NAD(P)H dehydrogenase (quinone)